jgi:hypothetical protein
VIWTAGVRCVEGLVSTTSASSHACETSCIAARALPLIHAAAQRGFRHRSCFCDSSCVVHVERGAPVAV